MRRNNRLEAIKLDILRKLKLEAPVNTTNRVVPRVPHIDEFRDTFEMQGDQPRGHHHHHNQFPFLDDDGDDDMDRATTLRVFNFAEPRKCSSIRCMVILTAYIFS
jgi:hypothetical protein